MNKKRYFTLLLIVTSTITGLSFCKSNSKADPAQETNKQKDLESLSENIGEKFNIENFIDTGGKSIKLDFTKSEITIVDFWFNECPPCNKEMSKFPELLKGKDKQITVISISVSGYEFWKKLFTDKSARYSFLSASLSNWHHLNLKSNDDPKLKNLISSDRYAELTAKLNVSFFPAYFVINKDGIIKERPVSAVEYILKEF
jgi:thiol-disulfide isomerase/thioredoxin